jgi:beta-1,4-N-acetylglucosaminyltransferase
MIFVTIGTTHFDSLIREVDSLVARKSINLPVICQIGSGNYIPQHMEYFRFQPSIDKWLDEAELVITHGGATVMSLLLKRRRFVAIANTMLAGDHQSIFLTKLAGSVKFGWSRDVEDLAELVDRALTQSPPVISFPHLADELRRYV